MLALDYQTAAEAEQCLSLLENDVRYVKVGMELYFASGPQFVYRLKERGLKVFVDVKVHDIPNTAKGAMKSLASIGVDMVNVHAAGGSAMMAAAREGVEVGTPSGVLRPLLIGVTMLTSTGQQRMNEELGIPGRMDEVVARYALLAKKAGLDGVVASPLEVPLIKQTAGESFVTVTPGIRPAGADKGDQTRVTTPAEAFALGSDYLVIGRAITAADDPQAAWRAIIESCNHMTGGTCS